MVPANSREPPQPPQSAYRSTILLLVGMSLTHSSALTILPRELRDSIYGLASIKLAALSYIDIPANVSTFVAKAGSNRCVNIGPFSIHLSFTSALDPQPPLLSKQFACEYAAEIYRFSHVMITLSNDPIFALKLTRDAKPGECPKPYSCYASLLSQVSLMYNQYSRVPRRPVEV
ncbi:hypothetical protein K469DRAFT_112432 [Zopfia rhizophila CBS 207.26]|uniref:Uncharacterized protein n=1 Tax=Zopfia rhizophila CBS 207.26 TaxID=1314779 RepID=A0A6A6EB46_9PEZI|nr:hypothetical protein K469DRAFT_112432 [Zopfia rhizophila CBS 207.26]